MSGATESVVYGVLADSLDVSAVVVTGAVDGLYTRGCWIQLAPPCVVKNTAPFWATAHPSVRPLGTSSGGVAVFRTMDSTKATPVRFWLVGDACSVQVWPPSFVTRIRPF